MINYAPPCDRVSRDGTHTYRQSLKAGDKLHVKVAPCQGDPDLYIWSPDWANVPGRPAWVSNLANNNKEFLEFVAPVNGEYQIEIYGYTAAQYNIQIEVTPGATELFIRNVFLTPQLYAQTISAGVDPLKDQPSAPALPPASRPSTDAGFVPVVPPPVELPIIRIIFLPAIRR